MPTLERTQLYILKPLRIIQGTEVKEKMLTLARKGLSVNCHYSVHLPESSWRANTLCAYVL